MNILFSLFLGMGLVITPAPKFTATVTEVTDRAIVEIDVNRGYRVDAYLFDFPTEPNDYEAEIPDAKVGQPLNPIAVYGSFTRSHEALNYKKERETLYTFEAADKSLLWQLPEKEIGFIPVLGKTYILLYDENADTWEQHKCPPELDCDCPSYDDLFLGIYEIN